MEFRALFDEKRRTEIREMLRSGTLKMKMAIKAEDINAPPVPLAVDISLKSAIPIKRTIPAEELARLRVPDGGPNPFYRPSFGANFRNPASMPSSAAFMRFSSRGQDTLTAGPQLSGVGADFGTADAGMDSGGGSAETDGECGIGSDGGCADGGIDAGSGCGGMDAGTGGDDDAPPDAGPDTGYAP